MYLSVIIPAKNEQKHIKKTVESVFNYLNANHIDHEILVVTNLSSDQTVPIVQNLLKTIPTLKHLNHPHQGGKGFAVGEGMHEAKGEYRLFMDADNSTTIDHIEKMIPYFKQGHDVVIGSIRMPGHEIIQGSEPFYRIFLGRLAGWYTRLIILPGILDTQRGFKILTARAVEEIFPQMRITQFGFDIELLALARKFGYKIKEVPIHWDNDPNSHVRPSAYLQVLFDTLRIKWWLMTGKYSRDTMSSADVRSAEPHAKRI